MGDLPSLLRLAEAGIRSADFESEVVTALAGGEIDEDTAASLRAIHRQIRGARRREDLLRALHDTATDLTGIRDVEAVLLAIVERTRMLAGTDMAYLSLNDYDTDETYIRKSSGVATLAYRTIRMPLGTGVLGKVATGLSPLYVEDYLANSDIIHLSRIDVIVRNEGVRSILGVPLNVHGRVIGALLVAERSVRRFTSADVDLLDTLGKHAAVALDNAQRFARVTAALEELGQERHQNQNEMDVLHSVLELDGRLLETVVGGGDLDAVVGIATDVFGTEVAVLDPAGFPLAGPERADWFDLSPGRDSGAGEVVARSVATGHALTTARSGIDRPVVTVAAALAGTDHLATLAVKADLPPPQRTLLARFAVFVAVTLLFGRAADDAAGRLQFDVLDDLIAGRQLPPDRLRRRLARFGLRPEGPWQVIVVDAGSSQPARVLTQVRTALRGTPALASPHSDHVCVLTRDSAPVRERIPVVLESAGLSGPAGFVGGVTSLAELPAAHTQARLAVRSLLALGRQGQMLDGRALGIVGLVMDAARDQEYPVLHQIAPLVNYDSEHDADLTRTAWQFLEADGNVNATAGALFVHRNTVRQRLARIAELLGPDWAQSPRRLDNHLALSMWRLEQV